jgi:putative multicomponent Na+:H+ antiporter subunit B
MNDIYIYVMVALLPLTASMVIFQVNPYHALVTRGILGAVAAMIYAVLGAADVALTEALVGTILAITLNAVAVRSSLVMRLGVLESELMEANKDLPDDKANSHFKQLTNELRTIFDKRHMRLELVTYYDTERLHQALMDKEVHMTCFPELRSRSGSFAASPLAQASPGLSRSGSFAASPLAQTSPGLSQQSDKPSYQATTRVRRIYEIVQAELLSPGTTLTYVNAPDSGEKQI